MNKLIAREKDVSRCFGLTRADYDDVTTGRWIICQCHLHLSGLSLDYKINTHDYTLVCISADICIVCGCF